MSVNTCPCISHNVYYVIIWMCALALRVPRHLPRRRQPPTSAPSYRHPLSTSRLAWPTDTRLTLSYCFPQLPTTDYRLPAVAQRHPSIRMPRYRLHRTGLGSHPSVLRLEWSGCQFCSLSSGVPVSAIRLQASV